MELTELQILINRVSDIYAKKNCIRRDEDWYLLKLSEELGELTQQHLKLSGRGRTNAEDQANLKEMLDDELADLFAHVLLYANHHDIDLNKAIERKWLKWLD